MTPTKTEKVSFRSFYCLNIIKLNRASLTKNAVAIIPKMAAEERENHSQSVQSELKRS